MFSVWWNKRVARERTILIGSAVLILVLLIDLLIWQPLNNAIVELQQDVLQKRTLLILMQHAKTTLSQWHRVGYTEIMPDSSGLLVTLEQSLMKAGLSRYLSNTSEQSETMIALSFSSVPFDALMDWQQAIWIHHNIIVNKETIKKGSTDGLVNVTMTLTRPKE